MQEPNPTRVNSKGRTVVVMDWTDPKVQARIDRLTDKSNGPTACWPWLGSVDRKGYGRFYTSAKTSTTAHRAAWAAYHKREPPENKVIDHLCRDHLCVNPVHLDLVTSKENTRRGLYVALKTHCAKGHPWIPQNIGKNKRENGTYRNYCILCQRAADLVSKAKRKERESEPAQDAAPKLR